MGKKRRLVFRITNVEKSEWGTACVVVVKLEPPITIDAGTLLFNVEEIEALKEIAADSNGRIEVREEK